MQDQLKSYPEEEEFSFRKVFENRKDDLLYLWKFRTKMFIVLLLAAFFGAFYAWWSAPTYTARLTFVVEESKAGTGGSLVSALAGQFGFDMSSIGGGNSVLAGDNVQEYLYSQKLLKKTLLTSFDSTKTLADEYAEVYKLKDKWASKYLKPGEKINFPANDNSYSRLQDSLIQVIMKRISEKELSVSKPDKKLTFFELSTTMRNEKLSQLFCTRLIKEATDFYILTKTQRLRANVKSLQTRADSITRILNRKTYSASQANLALLDANPAYPTSNVSPELEERDKLVLSSIYTEVIKNLEVSKTMLMQETPTMQIVDEPELPLKKNTVSYLYSIVASMVVVGTLYGVGLLIFKSNKNL